MNSIHAISTPLTRTLPALRRRAPWVMWLAAAALMYAALSPTLNVLRAKWQGQPQLFAELCTRMGIVKVALPGETPIPQAHSPECSMCLPAGTWLALAGADALTLPAAIGSAAVPASVVLPTPAVATHTYAWSRAPPAFS